MNGDNPRPLADGVRILYAYVVATDASTPPPNAVVVVSVVNVMNQDIIGSWQILEEN